MGMTIQRAREIAAMLEANSDGLSPTQELVLFMFRDMDNTGKIADKTPPFRQGTGGTASR